jgi:hypothetical protein
MFGRNGKQPRRLTDARHCAELAADRGAVFGRQLEVCRFYFLDPAIVASGDRGMAFVEGETEGRASSAFREVVRKIEENLEMGV